jgi:hypothetical protein
MSLLPLDCKVIPVSNGLYGRILTYIYIWRPNSRQVPKFTDLQGKCRNNPQFFWDDSVLVWWLYKVWTQWATLRVQLTKASFILHAWPQCWKRRRLGNA